MSQGKVLHSMMNTILKEDIVLILQQEFYPNTDISNAEIWKLDQIALRIIAAMEELNRVEEASK